MTLPRPILFMFAGLCSILLSGCFVQEHAHYGTSRWLAPDISTVKTRITFGYKASQEFSALQAFCQKKTIEDLGHLNWSVMRNCVVTALDTPEIFEFDDQNLKNVMVKAAKNEVSGSNGFFNSLNQYTWGRCLQLLYWYTPYAYDRPVVHISLVDQGGQCFKRKTMER